MELEGEICPGPHRGGHLIKYLKERIQGVLDINPYPGTMDVRLPKSIDLSKFDSCKTLQHVNPGGAVVRECFFVPCEIEGKDCWAMQQAESESRSVPESNVIELICEENLKEALDLEEGDKVKILLKT